MLSLLMEVVALVRLMIGAGFFTAVAVWFARLTSSTSTGAGELRVRMDLVAGRAAAISRGARSVWRRVSWAGLGIGGVGIGISSIKGSETRLLHDGLLHEGQPLVQPTRPHPVLQQMGPRGTRQSRTQPIFFTVFGMMQRTCFAQHGRQQFCSRDPQVGAYDPQLGARVPQLGAAHELQLGTPQPQPSLPP